MEIEEFNKNKYRYFFSCLDNFGAAAMLRLFNLCESEKEIFELSDKCVEGISFLGKRQKSLFLEKRKSAELDRDYEAFLKKNIGLVTFMDEKYPGRLKNISGAPYALFYRGRLPEEKRKYVSIIGARLCSDYGKRCAWYFGGELAKRGVGIISGGASGIDGAAQEAALKAGGESFAVCGCGVDICYPASNRPLYEKLLTGGGILSEFMPGTAPEAFRFPMRNRIISGLADLVLVIEAKEVSGTAITVNMALEQGREVYAVPGRICDSLSYGCNKIIKEGAGLATRVEDLLEELGITGEEDAPKNEEKIPLENDLQRLIYHQLKKCPRNSEELLCSAREKMGELGADRLFQELMALEILGLINNTGGIFSVKL